MTYIIILSIALWLILLFIISRLCKKIWKEGKVMKEKVVNIDKVNWDITESFWTQN